MTLTTPRPTDNNIARQRRDSKGRVLPKIVDSPSKPILDALNGALLKIRALHPEVPNAILVVGATSPGTHGRFHAGTWESKLAHNEITLFGESFKRGPEATLGTLIHECAHALAHARDIKDTSRQGRYHNEHFHQLAIEMGIEVTKDDKLGWSITTLPKATADVYKAELAELRKVLKAYRLVPTEEETEPKVKTTVKIACECRSVTVPISFYEKGDLTCNECGQYFSDEIKD